VPHSLVQFSYTPEAWQALIKNPMDPATAFRGLAAQIGVRLTSLDYCFGEYDVVAIFEASDDTTATAMVLAVISPGHAKASKTTKLLTVQEATEAMHKANSVSYQPPSKG